MSDPTHDYRKDLVRRLRQHDGFLGRLVEEAADEIERREEISAETLTSLLRKHITLEWLNASDGHPDITGFDKAADAILAIFAKEK